MERVDERRLGLVVPDLELDTLAVIMDFEDPTLAFVGASDLEADE